MLFKYENPQIDQNIQNIYRSFSKSIKIHRSTIFNMTVTSSVFSNLVAGKPDPILQTIVNCAKDQSPNKIDLSIGVYKTESGDSSFVFPSVKEAKLVLSKNDPGHCYTNMLGIPEFLDNSRNLIFGKEANSEGKIVSLQAISGTGALHMAFKFLQDVGLEEYYLGTPTWTNYEQIIKHQGSNVHVYNHYNSKTNDIDFDSIMNELSNAKPKSVFLLQACCHNPTGTDFNEEQWKFIASIAKTRQIFLIIDSAYLGFASGSTEIDSWGIRYLYSQNLEFIVCQSYSKNLALYSERVGVTHVVMQDAKMKPIVQDRLLANFRTECSFAPAYGARLASIIMSNEKLTKIWEQDVYDVYERLQKLRNQIYDKLIEKATPGNWEHVLKQHGLFWFTGLNDEQVSKLITDYHIHILDNGRVNVAGLNQSNIEYFIDAVDKVVR